MVRKASFLCSIILINVMAFNVAMKCFKNLSQSQVITFKSTLTFDCISVFSDSLRRIHVNTSLCGASAGRQAPHFSPSEKNAELSASSSLVLIFRGAKNMLDS